MLSLLRSLKKSAKLTKLQRHITPKNLIHLISEFSDTKRFQKREKALTQYIQICAHDPWIKQIMLNHELSDKNLLEIYNNLERNGGGQWVKGHYVALSSIAYHEPLLFYLEARKRSLYSDTEISIMLCDYFTHSPGGLYKKLKAHGLKF